MSNPPHHLLTVVSFATTVVMVVINCSYATAEAPTNPNYFTYLCDSNFGNYTINSPYEANLKSVLSTLRTHGSVAKFHSSSAADSGGRNAVYGQYYCRGDVDFNLCGDCIQQAAETIIRNCTLFQSAIVWYEECTLRYSNQTMVGVEAEYPRSWLYSNSNVSDPETLASVLNQTIDGLVTEVTLGKEASLFVTGEGALSASQRLYCLVQCSPDLNATACDGCLRDTYAYIPTCCGTMSKYVLLFSASCSLRYSTVAAFYAVPTAPPLPPGIAPAIPPTLAPEDAPTSSGSPPGQAASPSPSNATSDSTAKGASVVWRSSRFALVMTTLTLLMLVVKT